MSNWQMFTVAGFPTLVVLIGIMRNEQRFGAIEKRLDKVDARIDRFEARMEQRLDKIEADMRRFFETIGAHAEAIDTLKKGRRF